MILRNHTYFLWLYNKRKYRRQYHLGSGLFIWLFLSITQPFGIYNTNLGFGGLLLFMLVFAIVWPLVGILIDWAVMKRVQDAKLVRTNLAIWFVKIAIVAHAIYAIREYLCPGSCIDLKEYGEIWLASGLLFLFTYVPFTLYARYMYYHSMLGLPDQSTGLIVLKGHGREQLTLTINNIMYLRADDNYVDLYLVGQNSSDHEKEVLRSTLTDLQSQLHDHPQFLRIHRSFLVNTKYVLKARKKGSLTVLHGSYRKDLPVSKSYQDQVDQLFIHPK